jgi:hypothetical protein
MLASAPLLDVMGLLALGVGAALLGLALLLGGSAWRWCLVAGLAASGLAGVALGLPPLADFAAARGPLLALAGAIAACLFLSSSYPRRLLAPVLTLAGNSRVQGAALLSLGLLLVAGLPWWLQREADRVVEEKTAFADDPAAVLMHQRKYTLYTDRGAPVDVFDLGGHVALVNDKAAELQMAQSKGLGLSLIRTAPPDGASNCHGWVFTGGRYLVDGGDVHRILQDNGYDVVTSPRVGDLAVYRLGAGNVAHTALVRVVTDDGLVLLESKWSSLGCYLHTPEAYCPGSTWTYFRSPRRGHLLRGLEPSDYSPGQSPDGAPPAPRS